MREQRQKIIKMTELALLTAIVLILQLTGIAVRLPFLATPVSLVLIPIALGAMVLGPKAGAWLGFVFGAEVAIVCGVMQFDPFTAILFNDHPILTVLLCVVKGTLAGFVSGIVYKVLAKTNQLLASFVASAVAPVVNTGIFILGSFTMMDTFKSNFLGEGVSMIYFLVIGCAGLNFIFEFIINVAFAPALSRLTNLLNKRLGKE